jgi:hypothetical protein
MVNFLHATCLLNAACPLQVHAVAELGVVLVKIVLGLLYGGEKFT